MKNLTRPTIRLHFMRHKRVVIDTTHGPLPCRHLTMHIKSDASETSQKLYSVLTEDVPKIVRKAHQDVKAHQCVQYVEVIGIAANKLYRN